MISVGNREDYEDVRSLDEETGLASEEVLEKRETDPGLLLDEKTGLAASGDIKLVLGAGREALMSACSTIRQRLVVSEENLARMLEVLLEKVTT